MEFRKLRIAWSVVWGVAAVLLIALWPRSYWYADDAARVQGCDVFGIESACGSLRPFKSKRVFVISENTWLYSSELLAYSNRAYKHSTFGWDAADYPDHFMAYVPHWLSATLTAMIASTPWLPYRFKLRTLLIATTLVAIVLGLIAAVV
jgi:hypothetical protein